MAWERTETDHGVADIAAAGVTHMSILTQYVVPHAAPVDRTRSSAVGQSVFFPLLYAFRHTALLQRLSIISSTETLCNRSS